MNNSIRWSRRPPMMMLAALGLVLLSPVDHAPAPLDRATSCVASAGPIAVAALGGRVNADISALAGRAPYYLLFESSELIEVVPNAFADADRGVGARAAYRLSELGVGCLVAGAAGPRMRSVLAAENISFLAAEGPAARAVSELVAIGEGAVP